MFSLVPWRKEQKDGRELARWDDNPFALMRHQFDSLFDHFFRDWQAPLAGGWGLEVEDAGKEVVVRAEAPGFEPGDFDVQLSGDLLHVRAEQKQEGKEEGGRYRRYERTVTLPTGVDRDKVEARYRNGVLEL